MDWFPDPGTQLGELVAWRLIGDCVVWGLAFGAFWTYLGNALLGGSRWTPPGD